MMEHTTDRLFWTLTSVIIGALLLTIGIKAFPQMTNSTLQTFSGVTKQADTATNTASDAVNQVLNGYTNTTTGNNTANQQPVDPYAQAKANAVEASTLGFTAVDNGDGTASITYISPSNSRNLVIPPYIKLNGDLLKVTVLGRPNSGGNITQQAGAVSTLVIPDTVTTINATAFAYQGLTSVTFGKNVTTIADGAFKRNSGLTTVTVPTNASVLPTSFDSTVTVTRN